METLGFEWRRKTKLTNRARESIPFHPSEPGILTRTRRRRGHPLLLLDLHSTPARPACGGSGQTVRQGQGIRQRVGVRAPRRSGQGGRRRRGLGGSCLGLVVDWRETRRGARVGGGGGGGERSRSPASRVHRWCPCVPPLCPVVELTYRVVCLPEHQCAMHTVPLNFEPFYYPATKFYPPRPLFLILDS